MGLYPSGRTTIRYAHQQGAKITAFGFATELDLTDYKKDLEGIPLEFNTDNHLNPDTLKDFNLIIVTGGAEKRYETHLKRAQEAKVPITNDVDLALERFRAPIVAITGSNGKSTVSRMVTQALELEDKKVLTCGGEYLNFSETLMNPLNHDAIVMEMSSTRLLLTQRLHPKVAVFLNLYPGHVERHHSFEEYGTAKARIFAKQTEKDFLVYQFRDEVIRHIPFPNCRPQTLPFSYAQVLPKGSYYDQLTHQIIFTSLDKQKSIFSLQKAKVILGPHIVENFLAAINASKAMGVSDVNIQKMIDGFQPIEDRMEYMGSIEGIKVYNDARSVNMIATIRALQAFPDHSVILISGGHFKTNQYYQVLKETIGKKAKTLIIFGRDRDKFFPKWEGATEIFLVPRLQDAVALSLNNASSGDNVLFSPAAPPEFVDHPLITDRGMEFRALLKEQKKIKKFRHYEQIRI